MSLEFNLTPDDIERLVRDSIMKSGFGAAVEKSIKEIMGSSYRNPVNDALAAYVKRICEDLLETQMGAQIKEHVAAAIEAKVTKDFLDKVVGATLDKMMRDY